MFIWCSFFVNLVKKLVKIAYSFFVISWKHLIGFLRFLNVTTHFFSLQDQKSDNLTWKSETGTDSEVVWPGGKIPQDRTIVINQLLMVNLWLYLAMTFVAIFGILIAISLVYFNFRYGHRRIIQHCKLILYSRDPGTNNVISRFPNNLLDPLSEIFPWFVTIQSYHEIFLLFHSTPFLQQLNVNGKFKLKHSSRTS